MGQVNCQQCIPNLYDISFNNQIQKNNQPLSIPTQMHRINILSKHRNSHQIFTKKYSTQMTRQDTQQQSLQNKSVYKQKACIILANSQRSYRVEVQKGKKVTVGTSMNCHFRIPLVKDKFKVSIQHIDNGVFINDLGVGGGTFVKSSGCVFQRSQMSQINQTQLFMFNIGDNKLLVQISFSESRTTLNQISITMKNINQWHHQQQFIFNHIDILLRKQIKRTLIINQFIFIDFELILNPQNKYQIIFSNNQNCWKYINKKTLLKQNQCLYLGFQLFKVKKIILSSSTDLFNNESNQSDIKIVDFQS